MPRPLTILICTILFVLPAVSIAQENRVVIDKSKMPLEATDVKDFVPAGWVIEEEVSGDLNGDSLPDIALKLIQEKGVGGEDNVRATNANDRQRALVILSKGQDGKLSRAAVAEKLLQCAACGGAFYGMVEAPANVKIENGVLIVSQDHGSRNVVEQTFRFRYDAKAKKFYLIGLDVTDNDRASGEVVKESTNYLTGKKTTSRFQLSERANQAETLNQAGAGAQGGERANQMETRNQSGQGAQGSTRTNQAETLTPSGQGTQNSTRANQAETLTPSGQGTQGNERTNQMETLRPIDTKTTTVRRKRITIEEVDWEK